MRFVAQDDVGRRQRREGRQRGGRRHSEDGETVILVDRLAQLVAGLGFGQAVGVVPFAVQDDEVRPGRVQQRRIERRFQQRQFGRVDRRLARHVAGNQRVLMAGLQPQALFGRQRVRPR